ncbi:MAG: DUF3644 domain-containing protein [Elusimicrobiota bacterium]
MKGLPIEVRNLLEKARDSALLAVETYNRPTAAFRSGAYVVLMCIAWTSLFHAIFRRRKVRPWYRTKPGSRRYQKVDGDYKAWELAECLKQFYKDQSLPVRRNVDFFIGLRNKVEHRTYPQLDSEIFGECQALLINFEELLCGEFGDRYVLKTGLVFSLQFSRSLSPAQNLALIKRTEAQYRSVKTYVDAFRAALSQDVQSDLRYSFKVFLVPKIGNHATGSSVAVEFVKYDSSKPEEMRQYERVVAMIKPKEVLVANSGLLKPGEVVRQVAARLGKKFSHHTHGLCYRYFNTRPAGRNPTPGSWDARYCQYDALHKDYGYNQAWIDFLVAKLGDAETYDTILGSRNGMEP